MNINQKVGKRLQTFRNDEDIKVLDMATSIGVGTTAMSNRLAGRTSLRIVDMVNLKKAYPQLNLNDLIFGGCYD